MRFLYGIMAALLAVWLSACAFLFVWPDGDEPRSSDAIVVLAGGKKQRLAKGLELIREGVARTLVISDGNDPEWPAANRLCRGGANGFRVVCFRPDPYSTRGEVRAVARLARANGWKSIAVVTSTSHIFRAGLLFRRCLDGRVDTVAAGHKLLRLGQALFWETGKLVVAVTAQRDC